MNKECLENLSIRLIEWAEYSIVLSFLPIGISVLLSNIFGFEIADVDFYQNMFLTIVCIAVLIMKDMLLEYM